MFPTKGKAFVQGPGILSRSYAGHLIAHEANKGCIKFRHRDYGSSGGPSQSFKKHPSMAGMACKIARHKRYDIIGCVDK
jgi:hypothetical protein